MEFLATEAVKNKIHKALKKIDKPEGFSLLNRNLVERLRIEAGLIVNQHQLDHYIHDLQSNGCKPQSKLKLFLKSFFIKNKK